MVSNSLTKVKMKVRTWEKQHLIWSGDGCRPCLTVWPFFCSFEAAIPDSERKGMWVDIELEIE